MTGLLYFFLSVCAFTGWSDAVSTKMDFGGDEVASLTNSTKIEDEDVEVQHTIVLSTKLKNNNNRRGLHSSNDDNSGTLTYNIGKKEAKEDSGEVPVLNGYKSVETTQIRTPDTRTRGSFYPDSAFINRNVPINTEYNTGWRVSKPAYQTPGKFHRRISDDGMKEFYCKRCRELSGQGYIGCPPNAQQRNHWVYETTTPKMKLDGKLAKLN
ncbi:uncharacterized protein LOC118274110 isoform X2 [Spodoptera frugiperda]|uniref:Uncharacterized protein LOC118274110 isoform X2 n=1 Tax=Spodoptera frugiperda TaxID=7108 RepID=A0A9R0DXM7_SPOFR|nr:uncharacterized protein LOC118274110 isoform X2 [Spodoptera frugiperda]